MRLRRKIKEGLKKRRLKIGHWKKKIRMKRRRSINEQVVRTNSQQRRTLR
jgi:hypothetical protein